MLKLPLLGTILITLLGLHHPLLAADTPQPSPNKPSSRLNTQIYEKEDTNESFSATVKLVRDMAGTTQVMFEGKPGFYSLHEGTGAGQHQNLLLLSQSKKLAVQVKVEIDSRTIQSVEITGEGKKPAAGGRGN